MVTQLRRLTGGLDLNVRKKRNHWDHQQIPKELLLSKIGLISHFFFFVFDVGSGNSQIWVIEQLLEPMGGRMKRKWNENKQGTLT